MFKNKRKYFLSFLVLILVMVSSMSLGVNTAQAAPFVCDGEFYQSYAADAVPTTLYLVDRSTNPFVFTAVGDNSHGFIYNSIDYNPLDNLFYGISTTEHLLQIDNTGAVTDLGDMSLGFFPNAGAVTAEGKYVIARTVSGTGDVLVIDLALGTPAVVDSFNLGSTDLYDGDLVYNSLDEKIYGVAPLLGVRNLFYMDINSGPDQGVMHFVGPVGTASSFGSMFSDSLGNIYAASTTGGFYNINTTTGLAVLVSGSPSSNSMDGGSCSQAVSSFESDISLSKSTLATDFASGEIITYTITVANNGPIGAIGVEISDTLATGVTGTWTCSAIGGAVCTASGTGNIADTVSLPDDSSAVYTLVVTTPLTYAEATLSNTAAISLPLSVDDPNLSNNTAAPVVLSNRAPYTPPATSSGGGSTGSRIKGCNDKTALNYKENVKHVQSMCRYAEPEELIAMPPGCPIFTQYMEFGDRDGSLSVSVVGAEKGIIIREVALLQRTLRTLGLYEGRDDGRFGLKTATALGEWQANNFDTVLNPWGLKRPTQWFYQSSKRWMNESLGCTENVLLDNGVFLGNKSI